MQRILGFKVKMLATLVKKKIQEIITNGPKQWES